MLVNALLALVALLSPIGALAADFPITVYLVRHAERGDTPPSDPGLTTQGTARANKLGQMLFEKKVTAIYTSEFTRTKQTAKPLADRVKVKINDTFTGSKTKELAAAITQGKDRVVVVVGHSNTVPAVIHALGAGAVPPIKETEFDNIYIVTVTAPGKATVTRQNY